MGTRNISLSTPLDQFVDEQLSSGQYHNASEVVRAGLRLLKQRTEEDRLKLERLCAAIQQGLDDLDRGEGETVEVADLDSWLQKRGRSAG